MTIATARPEWSDVTAALDAAKAAEALRLLVVEYMTEAHLWRHAPMHAALVDTAHRLALIAKVGPPRVDADPGYVDVLEAFAYAGRIQLEHVQSTRRFAWGESPTIIPQRGGRE